MDWSDELFMCSRDAYFGVYFPSECINSSTVHPLIHFLHAIFYRNMTIKMIPIHPLWISLALITFYWLRHNELSDPTIVTRAREKWYLNENSPIDVILTAEELMVSR